MMLGYFLVKTLRNSPFLFDLIDLFPPALPLILRNSDKKNIILQLIQHQTVIKMSRFQDTLMALQLYLNNMTV